MTVQIKVPPLRHLLVQQLAIAVPPASGSALHAALDQLVAAVNAAEVNTGAPAWPASLTSADGFDASRAERQLRIAAAWAGQCALDCYLAGNGSTSATVRLAGPTGKVVLAVEISESGQLQRAEVTLAG